MGKFKNTTKCLKCPDNVREELKHYMAKNKNYDKLSDFDNVDNVIEIEDVDDDKGK